MKLSVQHYFDASHQLIDSPWLATKACARLHGHTYAVLVETNEESLNDAGMVIDFKKIKDCIDVLDHRHINDVFKQQEFDFQPTAENIAKFIHKEIKEKLLLDCKISICEGYKGREKASWAIFNGGQI